MCNGTFRQDGICALLQRKYCMHALLLAGSEACIASVHGVLFADNTIGSQDGQCSCSITGSMGFLL
jgi:hypothetical protein